MPFEYVLTYRTPFAVTNSSLATDDSTSKSSSAYLLQCDQNANAIPDRQN